MEDEPGGSGGIGVTECPTCQQIKKEHHISRSCFELTQGDFLEEFASSKSRKLKGKRKRSIGNTEIFKEDRAEYFLKILCAQMNEGHGLVYIHTKDPYLLGQFTEAVDKLMLDMIPDDTLYEENFERYFYKDSCHIVFKVLRREREHISTVNFKTKMSTNTSVVNPRPGQIRHFLGREVNNQSKEESHMESFTFELDKEVGVTKPEANTKIKVIFQESNTVEAKTIPQHRQPSPPTLETIERCADYCFDELRLAEYVSAFSKLESGGSVFLGVHEDKPVVPKWTQVQMGDDATKFLNSLGTDLILFKDNGQDNVYHVAQADQVPYGQGSKNPAVFTTKGVSLGNYAKQFELKLLKCIRDRTLWIPMECTGIQSEAVCKHTKPSDSSTNANEIPVTVTCHTVSGQRDSSPELFVTEVRVRKYHGLCFIDRGGPMAYQFKAQTTEESPEIEQTDLALWFRQIAMSKANKQRDTQIDRETQTDRDREID